MKGDRPFHHPIAQEIETQAPPGQPVQLGQRVYVQSPAGQQEEPQAGRRLKLTIDTDFLKPRLCYIKIAEFVVLLGAWASAVKYLDDYYPATGGTSIYRPEEDAIFFTSITIFCWVMVIFYLTFYMFSVPKICNCRRPSMFTLMSLITDFIMFALLLACTGNLVYRTADWGYLVQKDEDDKIFQNILKNMFSSLLVTLAVASAFGFLTCILLVVDMVLSYKLYQTQRAQETSRDQGPPQRRAWDVNKDYLRSPVFYVKLAEIVLLFAAWVCIIKYFADMKLLVRIGRDSQPEDSKADLFKGVAILSWVMAILMTLTSVLSFDKLCSRSSPWTLTTMIIDLILFILLLASCGNLVPRAVELEKTYKYEKKSTNPNIFALYFGVGFGFLSSIFFVVDMLLSYKSYQTQRAQETSPDQRPPQRQAGDVNKNYLKSPVFYAKLVEIALLFAAWVSILMHSYIPGTDQLQYTHHTEFILFGMRGSKPLLFRGITIFCWATVICLALTSVFSFDKLFKRSSRWTQMTLIIYFILFILLSASWGNLTSRAVLWGAPIERPTYAYNTKEVKPSRLDLVLGLAFGFLSCVVFVVDMVLSYKLYKTQLAQETFPDQGLPQRQAGYVNTKFLRSSAFCVRLAEFVFLFAAWVCIVNYIDFILFDLAWGSYQFYVKWPGNWDLKADFFHGVTVACWVMVSILVLTSVLSLDKLCNRSSRWTLTTMIIYFILSILLIASCGYLTPRAVDLKGDLSQKDFKSWPAIALFAGLVCGYISWLIFMLDICLLCILYRKQRAEEVRHPQQARHQQHTDQPLFTQQPAEVVDSAKLHSVSYV